MNQRSRAFAPNLGLGPPKGASIDRLGGVGASAGVCLLPWGYCGVAAVLAVCFVCCGPYRLLCGGGVPCGGKHIIIITDRSQVPGHRGESEEACVCVV